MEKCPEVLLYVDFLLLHTEQLVFVREQNVLLMRKIRATNSWYAHKDIVGESHDITLVWFLVLF